MLIENLKIALRSIASSKMRAILTVLGVMVGVAAVIAVVSIVQGMQYKFSKDLQNIGTNFFEVYPDPGDQRNPFLQKLPDLTIDDAEAVRRGTTAIKQFTPIYINQPELRNADSRHSAQMYAVNTAYQEVLNHWVQEGRFFTPVDEEGKKHVTVVGPEIVSALKLGDQPLGKTIQINKTAFTVVGVLETKGGSFGNNQDDIVIIPFSTATVMFGSENMRKLILAFQVRDGADLDLARKQVRDTLRSRHHLKKGEADDFKLLAQEEIVKTISAVLTAFTAWLALIVGAGLLVGGIGIMNIMLVSVTERTREIGIRKSIGARRRDVLLQFLIEAVTLSGLGGVVGVISGYLIALTLRLILNHAFPKLGVPPVHTPFWVAALAFAFCSTLGVIFGIYPAAKASKLDPIEALRYE
jgi:putative ABC transport system permease protein